MLLAKIPPVGTRLISSACEGRALRLASNHCSYHGRNGSVFLLFAVSISYMGGRGPKSGLSIKPCCSLRDGRKKTDRGERPHSESQPFGVGRARTGTVGNAKGQLLDSARQSLCSTVQSGRDGGRYLRLW